MLAKPLPLSQLFTENLTLSNLNGRGQISLFCAALMSYDKESTDRLETMQTGGSSVPAQHSWRRMAKPAQFKFCAA